MIIDTDDDLDIVSLQNPRGIRRGSAAYLKIGGTKFLRVGPRALAQLQREVNSLALVAHVEMAGDQTIGDAYCRELVAHAPEPTAEPGGIAVVPDPANGHCVLGFQFAEQLPVAIRLDRATALDLAAALIAAYPKAAH